LISLTIVILAYSCANIAMPTGGPKDVTPPKEVKSVPENYSVNFDSKRVRIFFDEFVNLKDVATQVIISPPMQEMPEFIVRGKSVIIDFDEVFRENTTYTVFLGSAIADITENNTIANFEYVFSTGNTLDSLSIRGKVINAFDNKPKESVLVMLYHETYDSVPYKEKPYYLTKTDKDGMFALNNLGKGKYKMFALMDANSNFIYDLPNESIAFTDSLLTAFYYHLPQQDSLSADSLSTDTIVPQSFMPFEHELYLFEEPDTIQQLLRVYSPMESRIDVIFRNSTEKPEINVLNYQFDEKFYIEDFNKSNDTLIYWITNKESDTLLVEVSDSGVVYDTVEVIISKPEKERSERKKKKDQNRDQAERLGISTNAGRTMDFFKKLELNSVYPLTSCDFQKVLLIENNDTILPRLTFKGPLKKSIVFDYNFKEETKYKVFVPDSVFYDINNKSNDTLLIDFTTNSVDDFGVLFLKMRFEEPGSQYIVQLLSEKEALVKQLIVTSDKELVFNNLKPSKYILKAIKDDNKNGKWDTGNYLKQIQPERVYFFPAKIHIRSKWEIEEEWNL
jgi:hypothetical protein